MATFSKLTFNALTYSASRPTYSSSLFEHIFAYHSRAPIPRWDRAVDVGCGTGQATAHLKSFREVIGIDPSPGMLAKARANLPNLSDAKSTYNFLQGSAEDLHCALPKDGSVDLLISAQAAHWFDWSKVWPETSRVLRRGGTAAFWVYGEFRLTHYPSVSPLITTYLRGTDPVNTFGPHWERPGRTILEGLLVDVPEPPETCNLDALERLYFVGGDNVPSFFQSPASNMHPVLMQKTMRWRDLLSYFRTFSALHTYHERHPEDLKRAEDTRFLEQDLASNVESTDELRGGDIAVRFWKDLRQGALHATPNAQVGADDEIAVEWPVALLLTRKL